MEALVERTKALVQVAKELRREAEEKLPPLQKRLSDITITMTLQTRCGSLLECERIGVSCDTCLLTELQKRISGNGFLPRFKVVKLFTLKEEVKEK